MAKLQSDRLVCVNGNTSVSDNVGALDADDEEPGTGKLDRLVYTVLLHVYICVAVSYVSHLCLSCAVLPRSFLVFCLGRR